jgi:hypothetical protein
VTTESFSAEPEAGEPQLSTPAHWGTTQLGDPPPLPVRPASWPPAADAGPAGAPPDQAPERIPDVDVGAPQEWPAAAPVAEPHPSPPPETVPDPDDTDDSQAVERLLRIAVVSRPLDDIADLVTRLEQTPDGAPTAASVLRLAAVARSVDDVTRMVELLGPPEHPADHMDEAIRHAVQERPIPEVTRLVQLLSRSPHDPHSSAEAVQSAATSRSVDDLIQLIGSLSENTRSGPPVVRSTPDPPPAPPTGAAQPAFDTAAGPARATQPTPPAQHAPAAAAAEASQAQPTRNEATSLAWIRRAAGVLMLLCAAVHLPRDWSHGPVYSLSAAIAISAVCALSGVALCLSRSLSVAVLNALVAGALVVGHLVDDRLGSSALAQVLRPEGTPAPLLGLSAVVAALAALLVVALTVSGMRTSAAVRDPGPPA